MSNLETLDETDWDVLISGTGLPQSLLALALSRSGKRVLHVDRNGYYGGAEAAFSLQEAESWVRSVEEDCSTDVETPTINDPPSEKRRRKSQSANFKDVRITLTSADQVSPDSQRTSPALGFSRAYSLALSPQLIYARSTLLPTLVSSKVYRQLEFLAMGSWWIYESGDVHLDSESPSVPGSSSGKGVLKKIPGAREDVFADKTIDLKSKRSLMKLLKQAADAETLKSVLEEWGERSFQDFLTTQYGLSAHLQAILHALTLSPATPGLTKTSYALPRINRHLTSIGVFGPGFGSVIPKWGGLSEVAQVACRASAVGGGTYVLGRGVDTVDTSNCSADRNVPCIAVRLSSGETVRTKWIAGRHADLAIPSDPATESKDLYLARLISIVSSPLSELMPLSAEGSPPAAGAVVVFPADSNANRESAPVYIIIHSGDTGECPSDQCVLYSSTSLPGSAGFDMLHHSICKLLGSIGGNPEPTILWTLQYKQLSSALENDTPRTVPKDDNVIIFREPSGDLAFDDGVLQEVREAYARINRDIDGFMLFEDRETGAYDDDDQ